MLFWNEWAALLVVLGCLIVATWSTWYVLSRHGVTRLVAAIVMLGALAAAVLVLIREHSIWRIALVLVLGLGAAALARVALGAGRAELRTKAPPGVHVGAASTQCSSRIRSQEAGRRTNRSLPRPERAESRPSCSVPTTTSRRWLAMPSLAVQM